MRALALVAGLALAAPLVAGCQSADETVSVESMPMTEAATADAARVGGAAGAAPLVAPGQAVSVDSVGRALVRTGEIEIRARDHADAVARARAETARLGGTVTGEESARLTERVTTTLTLRVPAARFDALMEALAATPGSVERRSVQVDDVTRPAADLAARLRVRRAAEARLVELVARAQTVEDVLAVQTRLDAVREEIESADAQLRALRTDVALSTVRATVYEQSATGLSPTGWPTRLARAVGDGWDVLLDAIIVAVTLWPLWLVVAGVVAWRRRRAAGRRGRDATLSGARP